jgi:hypothetical protein
MPLPNALLDAPDDTTVIGDLDAFMAYVESGQAWQDWCQLHAAAVKELDRFIRARSRSWQHIVCHGSELPHTLQPLQDEPSGSHT